MSENVLSEDVKSKKAPSECGPGKNRPFRIVIVGDSYTVGERVGKLKHRPNQPVRKSRVAGRAAAEPEMVGATY